MGVPRLHEHRNLFVERNLFLYAVIGMVSCGQRFEHFLEALAPGVEPSSKQEADRDVYLLLGVLGLWRRVRAELRGWATSKAVVDLSVGRIPTSAFPGSLLR